jgi:DNA-directed RNA polymerase specialized sigma24 family protein
MTEEEFDAVLRGEPGAQLRFIRDYGPVMRQAVERRMRGALRQHVDDVLHDIIVKLFEPCPFTRRRARALRKFRFGEGPLTRFLFQYAEWRTFEWMRRWKRTQAREVGSDGAIVEVATAGGGDDRGEPPEWLAAVRSRFLREFKPEEQQMYRLLFVEERAPGEVATIMRLSIDVVYQRKHRLTKRLRELAAEVMAGQHKSA